MSQAFLTWITTVSGQIYLHVMNICSAYQENKRLLRSCSSQNSGLL